MNTKISIGQYYPAKSLIHSLDPRVKLVGALIYIITLFFSNNIFNYLTAFVFLFIILYFSKVPLVLLLNSLKSILFIIIFTFAINLFLTKGETLLFQFAFISIYKDGLIDAFKIALRLVMLVTASSVLTLTTSPLELTSAMEYLLKPFGKIGVPYQEISMMMTITLRFIPTLSEELDKIIKAQIARGAQLDTGGLIKKAKGLIPILVPLFLSSFRRAEELAIAMESRCYRSDVVRTKLKEMSFVRKDYVGTCVLFVFVIIMLLFTFYL